MLGVRLSIPSNEVVVVLAGPGGADAWVLPIVIGPREGAAIAAAQAGMVPPRPQTHDLLVTIMETLGADVVEVRITGMDEGIYFAEIELSGGHVVDARPSDAIAIALRAEAPVLCDEDLLREAGLPASQAGLEAGEQWGTSALSPAEGEGPEDLDAVDDEMRARMVEDFRSFLDEVEPEDFNTDDAE